MIPILPTRDLLGIYSDDRLATPSNYWQNLAFNAPAHLSTSEEIIFEKIKARRPIAPFVLPTNQGRPIYTRQGSDAKLFKPAYIKPKDPVNPSEQFARRRGNLFTPTAPTPQQNMQSEIVDIMGFHRQTIERRWEWMAAQATLYGQVTVEYEDGPSVTVDFGRDAGLTVIKSTDFWDEDYDINADIQEWIDMMTEADFGGIPTRLTVGSKVWPVMRKNKKLLELMDLNVKNSNVDIIRGLVIPKDRNETSRLVGVLESGLEVHVYRDFYEDASGAQVPFMNERDVVLTAGDVGGVPAFGAILDAKAGLQPLAVFPKMWENEDPSAVFVMTQSSPLFIPVYPNRTFRARVLPGESA